MTASLLRVVFGYLAACLVAGVVLTLFVVPPAVLLEQDATRLAGTGVLMLMTATQIGVFAAPFAALVIAATEWSARRASLVYLLAGIAIAITGFVAQIATETGTRTLFNPFASSAFIGSGLAAGLIYWALAGRWAGAWHLGRAAKSKDAIAA